ncbi:hypothetical protein O0Q50_21335 [Priestia aryabhattai]|uniref:MarR family transcriptional regulator n=1 Tax=Priestia aryabhattai TaxID=412384 RepID=A0AAX6NCS3_PRIAR|nr:hypothetical protein [Priestia aryabhattai]MDU9693723.1 hypothetical protein [Priestia aryabhattai]
MNEESKDWRRHLSTKESLICFRLSLDMMEGERINLTEKEMMKACDYKQMKSFKNHLSTLIEKGIIVISRDEEYIDKPYCFNSDYVEYNEVGPRMYFRPLKIK